MSIALTTDDRSLSNLTATGRWYGLTGAAVVHVAMAVLILAWPTPEPVVEPATIVELVLAPPVPPSPPPPAVAVEQPAAPPVPRPVVRPRAPAVPTTARPAPASAPSESAAPAVAPSEPAQAGQGAASPAQVAVPPPVVVEDVKATPLSQPKPFYPRIARQRGWQGVVVVRVGIDEAGQACHVAVRDSSGHPVLDEAALETVRQWRFSPARQGGRVVASAIDVPIRFSLTEG